jgi:hypothetical protein
MLNTLMDGWVHNLRPLVAPDEKPAISGPGADKSRRGQTPRRLPGSAAV